VFGAPDLEAPLRGQRYHLQMHPPADSFPTLGRPSPRLPGVATSGILSPPWAT